MPKMRSRATHSPIVGSRELHLALLGWTVTSTTCQSGATRLLSRRGPRSDHIANWGQFPPAGSNSSSSNTNVHASDDCSCVALKQRSETLATPVRRILTIDAGGVKGAFPAAFLAKLEAQLGGPIADYFDLIAGTSTGGIIAIGLGLGLTAKRILDLYEANCRRIFPSTRFALPGVFRAKYAKAALSEVLQEVCGARLLGESRNRLIIPSLNLATEQVHVYKTSHHPDLINDFRIPAAEVALATAAAPTYFPVHLSSEGVPFIDGSVWAHNPMAHAVIEAIGVLEWPRESIRVLSLGCTASRLDISWNSWKQHTSLGSMFWAARLAHVFMKAQSSSAVVTAQVLLGRENVFRINPDMSHHRFTVDDVRHVPMLRQLGEEEALNAFPALAPIFFQEKAAPFVPYHTAPSESVGRFAA